MFDFSTQEHGRETFIVGTLYFLVFAAIIFYVIGLTVDERSHTVVEHTSFWVGITSLLCATWVASLASSIKYYRRTHTALTSLSSFLTNNIIPERETSEDDKMKDKDRLALRSQITNTLVACKHIDKTALEIFKNLSKQLEKKNCYYADIIHSVNLAIKHASDNNH